MAGHSWKRLKNRFIPRRIQPPLGDGCPLGLHKTRKKKKTLPGNDLLESRSWIPLLFSNLTIPKALKPLLAAQDFLSFPVRQIPQSLPGAHSQQLDGWYLDREFQTCTGLHQSSSLTSHFTDLKTKTREGRFLPKPYASHPLPGTFKPAA